MRSLALLALIFLSLSGSSQAADYAIVVSAKTAADADWKPVVEALREKHQAPVISYEKSVSETQEQLAKLHPRYTCFVARPEEAGRDFIAAVHRLTRAYDDDPWADTFWGVLTGYDAENALAIARHNDPLTVKKVSAGTELAMEMIPEGILYDELVQGKQVVKEAGSKAEEKKGPSDTTQALADTLTDYQADLFVTSGHATERDWMIGFRYRNGFFKSKAGQMFGETIDKQRFAIESKHSRVYLPVGNCLMGHIDGPDAMALAWMNSVGVKQMAGYTVPTWYGYAGWGMLDTFVEQPGRYTLAESFLANHQALLHRLYAAAPDARKLEPKPGGTIRVSEVSAAGKQLGVSSQDVSGLLHDRDVLAFYGDPAWEARMEEGPKAYGQELTMKDGLYTFTITPNRGGKSFEPINKNGSQRGYRPIVQFFPQRLGEIEIVSGGDLDPLIADDFILIPNPRVCDENREYKVVFRGKEL